MAPFLWRAVLVLGLGVGLHDVAARADDADDRAERLTSELRVKLGKLPEVRLAPRAAISADQAASASS